MSAFRNLSSDLTADVKSRAGWGIFLGIVTAALGVLLMVFPLIAGTVTTIIIGCILVIAGVLEIVASLRAHTAGRFILRLLLGVVYGFGGLFLVFNPLWGLAVLTVVLGVMLLFEAVVTAVLAFQTRPVSSWLLVDAAITAILGGLIVAHWPTSTIWAVGTLVGAALLVRGITRVALSTRLRRATETLEGRATETLEERQAREDRQARPPRAA
jgi:uncharacterized membrane protein HdeD (DUF308 family)